jgi:hypothetical protein
VTCGRLVTGVEKDPALESHASIEVCTYRIDGNGIIAQVGDSWRRFADENFGGPSCDPANVIGSSLLDIIHDTETRHLYETLFHWVRERGRPTTIPFRCDSPDRRRFLELEIVPLSNDAIEFRSRVIRTERREPVDLLNNKRECSDELVRICSMCKKIAVSETEWREVESAIAALKLFEKERMPRLSHGLCPTCFREAMKETRR